MGLSLALLVALFLLLPIAIVVPMSFSTAISSLIQGSRPLFSSWRRRLS